MEQKSHGISDFEKLYSRYYPKMVRFVTAYVLTRTDAENIVQDIFLDLLEKENVGSIHNLNAYLFRMAKNKSVDFLRHRIMREKKEDSIKDSMLREYNTLLYFIEKFDERDFSDEELNAVILRSIESLPEKCREIFVLNKLEGMKYAEIAEMMNLSENTVRNHIALAVKKLQKLLKDHPLLFLFLIS